MGHFLLAPLAPPFHLHLQLYLVVNKQRKEHCTEYCPQACPGQRRVVAGSEWQNVVDGQQIQLSSSRPGPTPAQPDFSTQISKSDTTLRFRKIVPSTIRSRLVTPRSNLSTPGTARLLPCPVLSRQQLVRICAVCRKYRYWPHECREGLHHQTSTNPPPTTKANATPGGPTPTIEARHLQFISTLVLPGCPVLVCRRPCVCPGPHHQLTDELPHLSTDTRPPPGPPSLRVPQSHSIPVVQSSQSLSHSQSLSGPPPAFLPVCRLHTPSPPQSQCILVGPGFCCFCLCSQLAYAASPRLSKVPVNGWPTTGQHETPWVGLAWSVKAAKACARA